MLVSAGVVLRSSMSTPTGQRPTERRCVADHIAIQLALGLLMDTRRIDINGLIRTLVSTPIRFRRSFAVFAT